MKRKRYYVLVSLFFITFFVGLIIMFTQVVNTKYVEGQKSDTGPIVAISNEKGRLILPLEGVIIKGKLDDLEEYSVADSQVEKDRVLEKLLDDPENVVIYIEKTSPPATDGEAVAHQG